MTPTFDARGREHQVFAYKSGERSHFLGVTKDKPEADLIREKAVASGRWDYVVIRTRVVSW